MAPAFPTRRAYESYIEQVGAVSHQARKYNLDHPLTTSISIASTNILEQENYMGLAQISDIFAELNSEGSGTINAQDLPSSPDQLLRALLPILVSAFLDSGPTAFSPETAAAPSTSTALESATNTIIAVAEIARDLWRSTLLRDMHQTTSNEHKDVLSNLEKLIAHMAVYFPFGSDDLLKRTSSDSTKLQNLNITFCELVALVSLATHRPDAALGKKASGSEALLTKPRRSKSKMDNATSAMSKYISTLLQASKSTSILSSGATVTPQMYSQLLPTIWSLLWNVSTGFTDEDTLEVVVRHFLDLPSTSGVKKLAFQFVSRLLVVSQPKCYTNER